ncbi:MAG: urea ABC transporter ATP-binding protein UrtD [Pseudolabrys sp.]|jgi:urea transport system ATP-binding protein
MTALLEMRDVHVSFSGFQAVAGLNLTVEQGELRCLIGPNGAGKTTALDAICGKARAAAGEILYRNHDITRWQEYLIARLGIGRKFQVPSVFKDLTVRENLRVAYCKKLGVFHNLVRGHNGDSVDGLEKLAELVGLKDELHRPARRLSHGQTQWLEAALLVAQDADLILMDEPTAGMTSAETHKTAELFNRLKGRHTLIVVEHDMGFVREIGDTISVMHQGRILAEGKIAEIEQNPEVKRAYLGSGGISGA